MISELSQGQIGAIKIFKKRKMRMIQFDEFVRFTSQDLDHITSTIMMNTNIKDKDEALSYVSDHYSIIESNNMVILKSDNDDINILVKPIK